MDYKQTKVINKLKKSCGDRTKALGKKDNDECYTDMQDIMNEMQHWGELGKFQGKKIICPCDWDIVDGEEIYSITIEYKDDNIELTTNNVFKKVKQIQYDLWGDADDEGNFEIETITVSPDDIEDFLKDKLTCNFIRTFVAKATDWGIKAITASGYNPDNGKGVPFQDVDYSQYDVCATNPPFSLYPEFMKCLVGNIDFVILAPFMNRGNPSIGLPLMLRQAYLGFNNYMDHIYFLNPTLKNQYNRKRICCDWLTSFPEAQLERNAHPTLQCIDYELYKDEYEVMPNMTMKDGTHPIKVTVSTIPDTYTGWMFGPVSILHRFSFDEFEWYGTHFGGYFNKTNPSANPFTHRVHDGMMTDSNGKSGFGGIVFRRKQKEEE